jgi:hypothetical protein
MWVTQLLYSTKLLRIKTYPYIDFFVRVAAAGAHDFFDNAKTALSDTAFDDALSITQILNDFAPQDQSDNNNSDALSDILSGIGKGLSLIKSLAPGGGQALGIIGAAFSAAAAVLPTIDQPTAVSLSSLRANLENQLKNVRDQTMTEFDNMDSKLFGGSLDFDLDNLIAFITSGTGGTIDHTLQPISQVLSTGVFMSVLGPEDVKESIKVPLQLIKQQLVASVLAAQNIFVFVDTTRTQDACNAIGGASFIDDQCYTLEKRTPNHLFCTADSVPIDNSIISKFSDPAYGIDLDAFYKNVGDCNNGLTNSALQGFHQGAIPESGTGFPHCAFNIPFLLTSGGVCNLQGQSGLPSNLQLTIDACHKITGCPHQALGGACTC